MSIDLDELLETVSERTREKLARQPEVLLKDGAFDVTKLPVDAPKWHRLTDVVAVVFDLKSSTNLERGRTPASTASIYDAGVGGVVTVLEQLGADFVDIQGDGGFGLFGMRFVTNVPSLRPLRSARFPLTSRNSSKKSGRMRLRPDSKSEWPADLSSLSGLVSLGISISKSRFGREDRSTMRQRQPSRPTLIALS